MVLNIYNTLHNYNIKKSGTITGTAAILEPLNETNIWVASVDATQKPNIYFRTHFFRTNVLQHFFTQIEKKFRVETKKAVGSDHRNQTFFIISPYLVNMSGAFDVLLSASEVFLSASDFLSPLLILLLAASD